MSTAIVDAGALRDHVRDLYRDVAREPGGEFHFETGRALAERLGYPAGWLDAVPPDALASFAGVGQMLDLAGIEPGEAVLDLGSGAVPEQTYLGAIEAAGLRVETVRPNPGLPLPLAARPRGRREVRRDERDRARDEAGRRRLGLRGCVGAS